MTRRTTVASPARPNQRTLLNTLLSLLGFTMLTLAACGDTPAPCDCPNSAGAKGIPGAIASAPPPVTQASLLETDAGTTVGEAAAKPKVYVLTPPKPSTSKAAPVAKRKVEGLAKVAPKTAKPKATKPPEKVRSAKAPTKPRVTPQGSLTKHKVDGDFGVIASAIATGMDQRQPTGISDTFTTDTVKLWAFIKVRNKVEPTTVTMVWKKDGKTVWSYELRVGKSAGWRTWSRKTVRKRDVGNWSVEVRSAQGELLETMNFSIKPAGSQEVAGR